MKRVKQRIDSGVVCEQVVFTVPERTVNIKKTRPKVRFKTPEERAEHRLGISRRKHVRIFNANFSPASLYTTCTMDDEHEVHTFQEAKKVRDSLYNSIRRKYPKAKIMIYMGRGKSTHRIHFHMVTDGVPEEFIREKWKAGKVMRVEHLREHNYYNGVDCGQDYTGLANYLFNHWTPEQGGHRWKGSRGTLVKPDYEDAVEVKRNYTVDKPPRAPKGYMLVEASETKYGFLHYKYVRIPAPVKRSRKKKKE